VSLLPDAVTREVRVDGIPVTYHDNGSEGRPVLLVHGTGGSMEGHFGRVVPMLAARSRVIGIELGTRLDRPVEIDDFTAQLDAVISDAGIGSDLTLVGYSLGAVVAAAFTATRPDAVGRLVLVNGWARTDAYQRLRNAIWRGLYDEGSSQLSAQTVFTAYGPRYLNARTPAEIDALVRGAVVGPVRAAHMELNARIDITALVEQVSCPTLVIAGEEDIMVPLAHGAHLLGAIPDARLVAIPTGHASMRERPAQVYSLIERFTRGDLADAGRPHEPAVV
jgi:pimeloyl-ACP methyl ester carboxylesterase